MSKAEESFLEPDDHDKSEFVQVVSIIQGWAHHVNRVNGFWVARDQLQLLAEANGLAKEMQVQLALANIGLIHTEPSEAVEAVRKQPPETWASTNKDTLVSELAGTVVRIMDLCESLKLPLGEAIVAEIHRNEKRGYMHGGAAA